MKKARWTVELPRSGKLALALVGGARPTAQHNAPLLRPGPRRTQHAPEHARTPSMAAFLPILQEILPMLMPGPVQIVRAEDVGRGEADDEGDEGENGEDDEDDGEHEREEREGQEKDGREKDSQEKEDNQDTAPRSTARTPDDLAPGRRRRPRPPPGGVSLRDAVVHKSSSLCASVLTVQPGCATVVFHNGEQDALIYAVSGSAVLATLPEDVDDDDDLVDEDAAAADKDDDDGGDGASRPASKTADPTTHAIGPGDFALIPAWTEHQVRNVGAADVVWVVVRNGAEPTVVPLRAWGGEQMDDG